MVETVVNWEQRACRKGVLSSCLPASLPKRIVGPELLELLIFQEKLEIETLICNFPFPNIGNQFNFYKDFYK